MMNLDPAREAEAIARCEAREAAAAMAKVHNAPVKSNQARKWHRTSRRLTARERRAVYLLETDRHEQFHREFPGGIVAMTREDRIAAGECVRLMAVLADSGTPHSKELACIVAMRLMAITRHGGGDVMDDDEFAPWLEIAELLGDRV